MMNISEILVFGIFAIISCMQLYFNNNYLQILLFLCGLCFMVLDVLKSTYLSPWSSIRDLCSGLFIVEILCFITDSLFFHRFVNIGLKALMIAVGINLGNNVNGQEFFLLLPKALLAIPCLFVWTSQRIIPFFTLVLTFIIKKKDRKVTRPISVARSSCNICVLLIISAMVVPSIISCFSNKSQSFQVNTLECSQNVISDIKVKIQYLGDLAMEIMNENMAEKDIKAIGFIPKIEQDPGKIEDMTHKEKEKPRRKIQSQIVKTSPAKYNTLDIHNCKAKDERVQKVTSMKNTEKGENHERFRKVNEGANIIMFSQFNKAWSDVNDWIDDAEKQLDVNTHVFNDNEKITQTLEKHKEFQKSLDSKQPIFDETMTLGHKLKEKSPKPDVPVLLNMLDLLKSKWKNICAKSVEKQKKLEVAMEVSGQFKNSLQALLDWLEKSKETLSKFELPYGDSETVMALLEQHKEFQEVLNSRGNTLEYVRHTARELLMVASEDDKKHIQTQLTVLENIWFEVINLAEDKERLLVGALQEI